MNEPTNPLPGEPSPVGTPPVTVSPAAPVQPHAPAAQGDSASSGQATAPTTPEAPTESAATSGGPSASDNKNSTRIGAVVAIAVIVGIIAWVLIARSDGNSSSTPATTPTPVTNTVGPMAVSAAALYGLVADVGHPVYWAGPVSGRRYEFLQTSDDKVYIRYLPPGIAAGDPNSDYLTIATYPFPDAYQALKGASNGNDVPIPSGGIASVTEGKPNSVHFAFPGVAYQGELYDPSAARALTVATSGRIQPVP